MYEKPRRTVTAFEPSAGRKPGVWVRGHVGKPLQGAGQSPTAQRSPPWPHLRLLCNVWCSHDRHVASLLTSNLGVNDSGV